MPYTCIVNTHVLIILSLHLIDIDITDFDLIDLVAIAIDLSDLDLIPLVSLITTLPWRLFLTSEWWSSWANSLFPAPNR